MTNLTSGNNVSDFLPSQNGLHYPNLWPDVPELALTTPFGQLRIGDAAHGLCGGMAFAVRDLFEAHKPPPPTTSNPPAGSPAFKFIVDRLFNSFDPPDVLRYITLMAPQIPSPVGEQHDKLSQRTIQDELPKIRQTIDGGRLCPIGIIRIRSVNPLDLVKHHQVLVWGYEDDDPMTTLRICDPDQPDRDDITIIFDHTHPGQAIDFDFNGEPPCLGFFVTEYSPADPAPLFQDQ